MEQIKKKIAVLKSEIEELKTKLDEVDENYKTVKSDKEEVSLSCSFIKVVQYALSQIYF